MADSKKDKLWAAAIKRAVHRRIKAGGKNPQYIDRLADQLVKYAEKGNGWAFKEIGERIDGKPHQSIGGTEPDGSIGITFKTVYEKRD